MPWVRGIVAALTKESEFGLLGVGWKTAGCATLARVMLEACGDVEKAHHLLRAAGGRPAARRIHSLEIGRIRIRGDVAQ